MPLYGGIDLHAGAHNSVVVILNEQRPLVIYQRRFANHLPTILEPLALYQADITGVVVESTSNWYWLVDGLLEAGYPLHLANPAAMQPYSGLKYTDDRSDVRWLAHVLRLGVSARGRHLPQSPETSRAGCLGVNAPTWYASRPRPGVQSAQHQRTEYGRTPQCQADARVDPGGARAPAAGA